MLTFFVIVILVALILQRLSLWNAGDHRNIRYECKPSVRACELTTSFRPFEYVTINVILLPVLE